ncbi:MAG: hypothetical protein ACREN2_02175 [Candidatus Dormibacteria bacterium]
MTMDAAVTAADVLDAVRVLGPSPLPRVAQHLELVVAGWISWSDLHRVVDDLVDADELVVRNELRRGVEVRVLALPATARP